MHNFVDNENETWGVHIDPYTARRVRNAVGFDLLATFTAEALSKLADDPALLVDVLYVVCREQADARGVTPEGFGSRLIGDAVESATDALLRALADFFPKWKRAILLRVLELTREAVDRDAALTEAALEDGAVDRAVLAALTRGA